MIKFELIVEVIHAVEKVFNDENRKHLIEASDHVVKAGEEMYDASMLVLDIVKSITQGNTSRNMLTSEVVSMLPEHWRDKIKKQ